MKAIARLNLEKLIDKGLNYPLVLIVAAPGSGKSTSLNQWVDRYAVGENSSDNSGDEKALKVIHFVAADKFNQGDLLFEHIFQQLSAITPLWEASFFKLFKSDQEADAATLIDIFIQGFDQITHPIAITIDDFHHIKSKRVLDIFNGLISRLPAHITFVFASRNHPDLSISKFKLEERVLVIDGNDLKLSEEELSTLNQLLCNSKIDELRLQALLAQTEGWFVGIKLALLAYAEDGDKALEGFSGTQPELLNYFAHEVINKLAPELRDFVLLTSICTSFNQTLCDAMNTGGRVIQLEELSKHELLITKDHDQANWFRYHPLLQSFLLQRLEIEKGADYIQSLHLEAAKGLLSQNRTSLAIQHARQSNDTSFYFETLLTATNEWLKKGEFGPIIDALNDLSDDELTEHPQHHLNLIYAQAFSRRFNQAGFQLDQFTQKDRTQAEIDTMRFLRFLISLLQSDVELQNYQFPKNKTTDSTPVDVMGFYLVIEAYTCMYNGFLNEAFRLATKAKHLLTTIEHDYFLSYANLILTLCDRYLGRGIDAIKLIVGVYNPIKHGPKSPTWINIASGMVVVDYEQNRLDEALKLGEELIPLTTHSAMTEVIVNAYFYSARICHIYGNKNKAKRLLDQLERILSLGDYKRFNSQMVHEKMRQAIQETGANMAEQLYKRYCLADVLQQGVWDKEKTHDLSACYEEHRERRALACVYALIAKGKFDPASDILNEILVVLEKQNLPSRAVIARSNLAMIAFRQNKSDAAILQLKRLIERYGLVCFSRTIFDEVPGLEKLFQHGLNENSLQVSDIFRQLFSSLFSDEEKDNDFIKPAQRLTEKENEIFELLSSGLSNAAISEQSGIALSTTKWHLKNIYAKLGVENRSSALMMAHKKAPA